VETRAHHILIGLFVLVVALAAMVFTLWMSNSQGEKDSVKYDIVFSESVTGLSVGNDVLYNGIRVGEVTKLSLDKKDPRKVWARVRISETMPISTETRARLTIANITGAAIIQLLSGPPNSPPLEARDGKVPVIPSSPSPFTTLRTSSEELLVNISQLVNNAGAILSSDNADKINNILQNLDTTTAAFAEEKDSISQSIEELAIIAEEIPKTLKEATDLMAKVNMALDNQGDYIIKDFRKMMQAVRKLSEDMDKLVNSNQGAINSGLQGFAEIGPMLRELRETADSFGRLSRRMEEDPSAFFLGSEQIQEYQP
jgi:phospholipid/cholesterol/gamma-HCH transport system substrate-binding protein